MSFIIDDAMKAAPVPPWVKVLLYTAKAGVKAATSDSGANNHSHVGENSVMSNEFSGEHGVAKALLSVFTGHQLSKIQRYIWSKGNASIQEMSEVRQMDGIPPAFSVLDLGPKVDGDAIYNVIVAITHILSAQLANDANEADYAEVLVEGAGWSDDAADEVAKSIVVHRGAMRRFGHSAMKAIHSLPFLSDPDVVGTAAELGKELTEARIKETLNDPSSTARNNLIEWRRLGAAIRERYLDGDFMAASTAFEYAIHGGPARQYKQAVEAAVEANNPFETGAPSHVGHYGYDVTGQPYSLDTIMADVVGQPMFADETGAPFPVSPERSQYARAMHRQMLRDVSRVRMTPYHEFGVNNPEEGGFFGSIFKGIKKLASPLTSIVGKILPAAGSIVGSVFGGPLGGALGGKVGSVASSLFSSSKAAPRALPAVANTLDTNALLSQIMQLLASSRALPPPPPGHGQA